MPLKFYNYLLHDMKRFESLCSVYIHISCCFPFPTLARCERTWGTSGHREYAGAGWKSPVGIYTVHLLSLPWTLYSSATVSLWVTLSQHPCWRLPVLQTPEWWGALQQPAHWDASCQVQLGMKTNTHCDCLHVLAFRSFKLWCVSNTDEINPDIFLCSKNEFYC